MKDYQEHVRDPWCRLKAAMFGCIDTRLHASDLRAPSEEQLAALGAFFKQGAFGRIAVLASVHTSVSEPIPDYQLVARCVLERIGRLVVHFGCEGAVLVHEESARTDHLAAAYFGGYSLSHRDSQGTRTTIPLLKYRMPKAAGEPFLEVADFIMHAAGGQVRASLAGCEWGGRKDFRVVFQDQPEPLAQFFQILGAAFTPM